MNLRVYTEDLLIARELINHNEKVTREFFYRQCYPLFKSIYDNYYTDCTCCKEFIDEIYLLVLAPSRYTGKCRLQDYKGESTLATWLKTVCVRYCYGKFERKKRVQMELPQSDEEVHKHSGDDISVSIELDFTNINKSDVMVVLNMMPNKRYSTLLRLRYLEELSNEETAELMGMSLDNYYNKHKLAKAQYEQVLRKESRYA